MNISSIWHCAVAALAMFAAAQPAHAAVSCTYIDAVGAFDGSMPMAVSTIVVPRDAPVGTIIYTQKFAQAGNALRFDCNTKSAGWTPYFQVTNVKAQTGYVMAVYGLNVFKTDVPGIGVAWWGGLVGGTVMTETRTAATVVSPYCIATTDADAGHCRTIPTKFSSVSAMSLIKVGPVGAGLISGSSLGKMILTGSFNDSKVYDIATVSVRGSIAIVSQTCTTPNVSVALGRRQVSSLKGIDSTTPQVNFSIALTNCPAFTGLFRNAKKSTSVSQDEVLTPLGEVVPNTLSIRFDPGSTAIDAPNGVLSLSTPAGVISASGVGVQLLDAEGAPRALSTDIAVNVQLGTSMTIAMGARYIQTAAKVTPGVANAVATYTLIYQ